MAYVLLKTLHIGGAFLIIMPLGALALHRLNGGTREQPWRKQVAMTHGIGMLLTVVCGFAMAGQLHVGMPGWIAAKLLIWLALGAFIALVLRKGEWARALWWLTPLLGMLAAYFAVAKPF